MEPIPNWYRWLLIIIATLVMCACRSPLQDQGKPLMPIMTGSMVTSSDATPTANRPAIAGLNAAYLGSSLTRRARRVRQSALELNDMAKPKVSQPARTATPSEFAPVIRTNERGTLQLQRIESILVAPPSIELPEPTKNKSESAPAVYLRVNDQSDELQTTNAQLESEPGDLGTPFLDDPVLPLPSEPPLAPMIEHDTRIEHPAVEQGVTESILAEGTGIGEPFIIHEPETSMDLAPSECLVDTSPGCWLPVEPANLPRKELSQLYPDEYICDGGDAQNEVHVRRDWSLQGLDPEDTVGHYDRVDGAVVVEPTNRVCIYAPRFAAVRKVTAVHENEKNLQLQLAERDLLAVTDESQQLADQFSQNLAAQRHLALQPAASFKSRQPGVETSQGQALHVLDKDLSAHENLRVMKYGVHKQSEKARLAEFTANAITWSHDKAVQVVLDEVVAQTRVTRQGTDEIFSTNAGPAKFRVIKTASVSDALPGEEVEFTLRFDNVGYQPIGNVTIVDNLTTRLEYIADSQQCSLEAEFVNDQNQVNSLTLRWEITDPIAPGKGGLIRFRCRVR